MQVICVLDGFKAHESEKRITLMDCVLRKLINPLQRFYMKNLPHEKMRCNTDKKRGDCIVSLTSFPERINSVYLTVKSLLNQTLPPKEIILWLSEEQFPDHQLPKSLTELFKYGLTVRYCKNLMAHKKYYYTLQEFADQRVITYDDDLIYREDSIEKLMKTNERFPDAIICNRGRMIVIENEKILGYDEWILNDKNILDKPSYLMIASTGAGTLYPPHSMPVETFNEANIRKLAFTADDLWMKAMSILGHTKVVCTPGKKKPLCLNVREQKTTLAKVNVGQHQNDVIFQQLLSTYPEIKQLLHNESQEKERK